MKKLFAQKITSLYNPTNDFKGVYCIDAGCCESLCDDVGDKEENLSRSYFTLLIIAEGKGVVSFNGKTVNVKNGDVLFVPPCASYINRSVKDVDYRYFWLSFEGVEINSYLKSKTFYKESEVINPNFFDKICLSITKFLFENTQETVNEEKFNHLFFEMLEYLSNILIIKKTEEDYIDKIFELINDNYENSSFNIKTISDSLHLSHSWLCALFKSKTKYTMQQWLISVRLNKAKELLVDTDLSVSNIAYLCGFNDALYFSTSFKKMYGKSPTCYRLTRATIKQ